jgi:hypothetical protein
MERDERRPNGDSKMKRLYVQSTKRAIARTAIGPRRQIFCVLFAVLVLLFTSVVFIYVRSFFREDAFKWNMFGRNFVVVLTGQNILMMDVDVPAEAAVAPRWESRARLHPDDFDFSDFLTVPGPYGPYPLWSDGSSTGGRQPIETRILPWIIALSLPCIIFIARCILSRNGQRGRGFDVFGPQFRI